jgi:predicted kinase
VDALADAVAQVHEVAPVQQTSSMDQLPEVARWQSLRMRTIDGLRQGALSQEGHRLLSALETWLVDGERSLATLWTQRRRDGWVRDGHGDLHLGNVCWFRGRPQLYDGLEFDEALRITDIAHDLAFLLMDLWAAGHHAVAWRLASRYLERLPDWSGVPAWPVFVALRALVRWRVAQLSSRLDAQVGAAYQRVLAQGLVPRRPALILMHGWSGSGKSVVSQGLVEALGALRMRSDVVRHQLEEGAPDVLVVPDVRYAPDQKARVYAQMRAWAAPALHAGWRVVLDATHLSRHERQAAQALAAQVGVPWVIVSCQAPVAVLRDRVRTRQGDASEADESVLERQLNTSDALTEGELARTWVADTTRDPACWTLRRTWRPLARLMAM